MNSQQQFHNIIVPPKFIMVGLKGKNATNKFYEAPRDIWPIEKFKFANNLQNISLIIAALFPEKPCMKDQVTRDGKPFISRKSGEPKRIVDWNGIEDFIRYFGFVDLDMNIADVMEGKAPLIQGEEPQVFEKVDQFKQYWSQWLKDHHELNIGDIRPQCKPFHQVCLDAEQLVNSLQANNLQSLVFFSGCKGFRVLWYDPKLFFWCSYKDQYAKAYQSQIATKYFMDLGCDSSFASRLDCSVYDNRKGIKPDVCAHPDSLLWPFLIQEIDKFNEYKLCNQEEDKALTKAIQDYWVHLAEKCPLQIPHLRTSPGLGLTSSGFTKVTTQKRKRITLEEPEPEQQQQLVEDNNSNSNNNTTDLPVHNPNTGVLSEEFQEGIIKWMRKYKANLGRKYVLPDCHMKQLGGADGPKLVYIDHWNFCGIARKEHSAEKQGKVYFIIDSIEIKQKCHSDKCRGAYEPVYTIESEKQRRSEAAKIALKINAQRRKQEHLDYEREQKRRFAARSPSPTSRTADSYVAKPVVAAVENAVNTKYLPKYTEIEIEPPPPQQQQQENKSPIDWFRYRYFADRLACKSYYLHQFKSVAQSPQELPIYPLVLTCSPDRNLDDNYIEFPVSQLKRYHAFPERYRKYLFFVVLYHEPSQSSVEWGYLTSKRLYFKEGSNKSIHVIRRDKCNYGMTYDTAFKMFLVRGVVPGEIRLNPVMIDDKQTFQWDTIETGRQVNEMNIREVMEKNVCQSPAWLAQLANFEVFEYFGEIYQEQIQILNVCPRRKELQSTDNMLF